MPLAPESERNRKIAPVTDSAETKRYNLVFPENQPDDALQQIRRRRLLLQPKPRPEASWRWIEQPLLDSITHFEEIGGGLILIEAPRRSGCTRLMRELLPDMPVADLDDEQMRFDAGDAPKTFLSRFSGYPVVFFRHAHRCPELLSFLINRAGQADTNSKMPGIVIVGVCARLPLFDQIADNRCIRTLRLRTLAQGEVQGQDPGFPERLLTMDFPVQLSHNESNRDLILEMAMHGGYPGARQGTANQRHDFFHDLIRAVCSFDLPCVSRVKNPMTLRKVYRILAATSGTPLNLSHIAQTLDIGRPLARDCIKALEALYLAEELYVWPQAFKFERCVKTPRYFVPDSGWLCGLLGFCDVMPSSLNAGSQSIVNRLIKGWIYAQLRSRTDNNADWKLWYVALRTGLSLDYLLENQETGALIALQCSSRESVSPEDFSTLKKFRLLVKDRPVTSVLLYCGQSVQRFEGVGTAVPLAFLWR